MVAASVVLTYAMVGFGQAGVVQQGARQVGPLGVFEGQTDIGKVNPPGTASFDAANGSYTVASAGWDLWADTMHSTWCGRRCQGMSR